ncbi:MAG TPA: Uma2 family endonuclease [Phototrophicaceae bacterium]|nr:Uma2 family endonuclease [Phototrophicaceae bacterium]
MLKTKSGSVAEFKTFLTQSGNDDRLLELVNGRIVEKTPTQIESALASRVYGALWSYSRQQGLGRAVTDTHLHFPGDDGNVRLADVAFYTPEWPALIVEVKLPELTLDDLREKVAFYLTHGTRLVWLICPVEQQVWVITPERERLLTAEDWLDGDDVLPGFSLPVSHLFIKS